MIKLLNNVFSEYVGNEWMEEVENYWEELKNINPCKKFDSHRCMWTDSSTALMQSTTQNTEQVNWQNLVLLCSLRIKWTCFYFCFGKIWLYDWIK